MVNVEKGSIENKIQTIYTGNIAINHVTKKAYVSDSKNNHLYEVDN
ncbi:MAG: hypothetical protein ACRD97_11285 [Nitrososphaeraceae archaeon]